MELATAIIPKQNAVYAACSKARSEESFKTFAVVFSSQYSEEPTDIGGCVETANRM